MIQTERSKIISLNSDHEITQRARNFIAQLNHRINSFENTTEELTSCCMKLTQRVTSTAAKMANLKNQNATKQIIKERDILESRKNPTDSKSSATAPCLFECYKNAIMESREKIMTLSSFTIYPTSYTDWTGNLKENNSSHSNDAISSEDTKKQICRKRSMDIEKNDGHASASLLVENRGKSSDNELSEKKMVSTKKIELNQQEETKLQKTEMEDQLIKEINCSFLPQQDSSDPASEKRSSCSPDEYENSSSVAQTVKQPTEKSKETVETIASSLKARPEVVTSSNRVAGKKSIFSSDTDSDDDFIKSFSNVGLDRTVQKGSTIKSSTSKNTGPINDSTWKKKQSEKKSIFDDSDSDSDLFSSASKFKPLLRESSKKQETKHNNQSSHFSASGVDNTTSKPNSDKSLRDSSPISSLEVFQNCEADFQSTSFGPLLEEPSSNDILKSRSRGPRFRRPPTRKTDLK